MLKLPSSKGQELNDFWKPSKPSHVGINWIGLTEYSQMSTHLPGFSHFSLGFSHNFVLAKLAASTISVNIYEFLSLEKQFFLRLYGPSGPSGPSGILSEKHKLPTLLQKDHLVPSEETVLGFLKRCSTHAHLQIGGKILYSHQLWLKVNCLS